MTDWSDRGGRANALGAYRARVALLILLSVALAGAVIYSFQLNFGYDTAQMLYYGRLIAQAHFVPYRDIFEENLPGAMLAYTAIGTLIDYSNRFLLRFFDMVYLTAISLATYRWLRPLGKQVAWAAVVLFGVFYLLGGPGFSTQREYIFLLPVVAALAVSTSAAPMPDERRALIVGLLFGLATTIKPHAAIGLLPVWVYHYFAIADRQGGRKPTLGQVVRILVFYALGGLIPVGAVIVYLILSGGLRPWLAIVTNYWPLYATLTDSMNVLTGADRVRYIASNLLTLGGKWPWLIPVIVGAVLALRPGAAKPRGRRRIWLMVALVVCYALYPAVTGQFYPQHWLPLAYFILVASGLCFLNGRRPGGWLVGAAPLAAVVVALGLSGGSLGDGMGQMVDYLVYHTPPPAIDGDRAAEIAGYLEGHLQPGDTVQPLDQVGYGMHGMLLARAAPATRFQADAQFYEEPRMPYIQGLRAEFMSALRQHPPRYVIDVVARARIQTEYTITPFTDFEQMLRDDYALAYVGHGFLIYEHVSSARPGLVIYPVENSGTTPDDLAPFKADLTTFASGKPAANPAALARKIQPVLDTHDLLYFENLGEDSVSSRALELWLDQNALRVSEQRLASTRLLGYLSPHTGCLLPGPVNFEYGGAIHLGAAKADLVEAGGHHYVCAALQLTGLHVLSRDYALSVHVVDASGASVAQYDSQPLGNLFPTTRWTPGQPNDERFAVRLPDGLPGGDYRVAFYIYDAETQVSLTLKDGTTAAPIGSIHIH